MWVAVEDDYGRGAAVAAVAALTDERFEVDAWLCEDRDAALAEAQGLVDGWAWPTTLIVGPALSVRRGQKATSTETRYGLTLLRSMVEQRRIVHDDTPELDEQLRQVRVREVPGGGLSLAPGIRADAVRALTWALRAAVVRRPEPAIR
jgi:hypothetical protein